MKRPWIIRCGMCRRTFLLRFFSYGGAQQCEQCWRWTRDCREATGVLPSDERIA